MIAPAPAPAQFRTDKMVKGELVPTFKLHPGQAKAWRSKSRFTFIIAGTQGGKTSFLPLWLGREIERRGAGDYLAATATYDLFKLKFLPEMRAYFVNTLGWKEDKGDMTFHTGKGDTYTRIILRSATSEGGLESATVKGAVLDECGQDAFRITAWEAVQRRLSIHQGRVLAATTPYNFGWLKQEIYDKWRAGDKDVQVVQFPSIYNPIFPIEEFERARASKAAWKFSMFYKGEFSRPAGLIYEDFIDEYKEGNGNKVHPFDIPASWPRYVGIDFGPVHTATIWIAEDPNINVYYIYRETLEGGMTTGQHVSKALDRAKNENVISYTGGAGSEDQYRMDWASHGVKVKEPPIKEVESGIDKAIDLIKTKRLFVFDNCKDTLDELGTYSRVVDDMGNVGEIIKDKGSFHLLDALRYDVVGLGSTWLVS